MPVICALKNAAFSFCLYTTQIIILKILFWHSLTQQLKKLFLGTKNIRGAFSPSCTPQLMLMLRNHTTCLINYTTKLWWYNYKFQCHWSLSSQKNLITNISLSYQASKTVKFTLWDLDFMQIKFITETRFGFYNLYIIKLLMFLFLIAILQCCVLKMPLARSFNATM